VKQRTKVFAAIVLALGGANVQAACGIATTPISFGAYDVFSVIPLRSTGTFTVTCNEAPPPTVMISVGPSAATGIFNPRQMRSSGGDLLDYNLFTDSAMTQVWGDGLTGGSTLQQKVTKNKPWNAIIYGNLPAQQNVSVGSYSDSVVVTIMW
jgi:spore coat protein U-like protein